MAANVHNNQNDVLEYFPFGKKSPFYPPKNLYWITYSTGTILSRE